ncbi:MAG TPA: SOS response-associated peptidase [Acidimicrobiales bacterium]|nr:SOS response-associated peptidase [Acidimicrobiales bacterium]
MCGRVDIHTPPAQLARALEAQLAAGVDPDGRPSWNVGPTRAIPAVVENEEHTRVLDLFRWGLVPHWAKDPKSAGGYKMINARAETMATKPAYRSALARRRCLIVVDGFFEWAQNPADPKRKIPFYFQRTDGQPITMAGLWETWWDKSRSPDEPDPETYLQTAVIVTTAAGPDMEAVHDRMPVIIEEAQRGLWLDPEIRDVAQISGLLHPAPGGTLIRHTIATEVNNVRNDEPGIIEPVDWPEAQLLLPPGARPG